MAFKNMMARAVILMAAILCLPLISSIASANNCTSLIYNGPSEYRHDIVIVGSNYTEAQLGNLASDVDKAVKFMFANMSAFANYSNLYNVWYVNESADLGCSYSSSLWMCGESTAATLASQCPTDNGKRIVIINDARYGGSASLSQADCGGGNYLKTTVSHEYLHTFGELMDEYNASYPGGLYWSEANCATAAEAQYVQNTTACNKWSTIPNAGCYISCAGYALYRSTPNSIMRSTAFKDAYMNKISEIQTLKMLKKYANLTVDYSNTSLQINQYENVSFSVTKVNSSDPTRIRWFVEGIEKTASENQTSLSYNFTSSGNYTVTMIANINDINETKSWNVEASGPAVAPSITVYNPSGNVSMNENSVTAFTITAEGTSPLTYSWKLDNAEQATTQNWNYNADYNSAGEHNMTVTVSNAVGSASHYWNTTVNNVNRAPVLNAISDKSVDVNTELRFNITASDADADTIYYSANSTLSVNKINNTLAEVTWTPAQTGNYYFELNASDTNLSDKEIVKITVTNPQTISLTACGTLSSENTVYNLQNDVSSSGADSCFEVSADNITLDCNNYKLTGNFNANGININGFNSAKIKNCNLTDFYDGIHFESSGGNEITNTVVNMSGNVGIYIYQSSANLSGNTVSDAQTTGIYLEEASPCTISENIVKNSASVGIVLISSAGISFSGNNLDSNPYGYYLMGSDNNNFNDDAVKSTEIDFLSETSAGNVIKSMAFTNANSNATFTYTGDVQIKAATPVADSGSLKNMSKYLDITPSGSIALNISYKDSEIPSLTRENSLKIYKDNSGWQQVSGSGVDTASKTIFADIDSTGTFATLGTLDNAPVLNAISDKTVDENTELRFNITASDADADTITYSANSTLSVNKINNTLAEVTWTPSADGVYYFNLTASDGIFSDSKIVKITVNNVVVNTAPVLSAISDKSIQVNSQLRFNITATDAEADTITYSSNLTAMTVNKINNNLAEVIWTPTQTGTFYVEFTASDASLSDKEVAKITVTSIPNTAPVISWYSSQSTVAEASSLSFQITATDAENDALTYSWKLDNVQSAITQNWTYNPGYTSSGNHNVTVTASDGSLSDYHYWNVVVSNTNRAPVLNAISDKSVQVNSQLRFNISASDADSDTITYSSNLTAMTVNKINNNLAEVIWTPTQTGTFYVEFTASDASLQDKKTAKITVTSIPNTAPVLNAIPDQSIQVNTQLRFNISATDAEGNTITYSANSTLSVNKINNNLAEVTWTPAQTGTFYFDLTASDGSLSDKKTVKITVNAVPNTAPVLNPIASITAYEGDTITINPTATDPDGNPITYSYSGWMTSNSKQTGYNDAGLYTINITASDGSLSDSKIVNITVINSYRIVTAISDKITRARASGNVKLDSAEKQTNPSSTATYDYVHSGEHSIKYSASGYKDDNAVFYLDNRIAGCSTGANCALSGSYNTSCKWNAQYSDFTCTLSNSFMFVFNPSENSAKWIDYISK